MADDPSDTVLDQLPEPTETALIPGKPASVHGVVLRTVYLRGTRMLIGNDVAKALNEDATKMYTSFSASGIGVYRCGQAEVCLACLFCLPAPQPPLVVIRFTLRQRKELTKILGLGTIRISILLPYDDVVPVLLVELRKRRSDWGEEQPPGLQQKQPGELAKQQLPAAADADAPTQTVERFHPPLDADPQVSPPPWAASGGGGPAPPGDGGPAPLVQPVPPHQHMASLPQASTSTLHVPSVPTVEQPLGSTVSTPVPLVHSVVQPIQPVFTSTPRHLLTGPPLYGLQQPFAWIPTASGHLAAVPIEIVIDIQLRQQAQQIRWLQQQQQAFCFSGSQPQPVWMAYPPAPAPSPLLREPPAPMVPPLSAHPLSGAPSSGSPLSGGPLSGHPQALSSLTPITRDCHAPYDPSRKRPFTSEEEEEEPRHPSPIHRFAPG